MSSPLRMLAAVPVILHLFAAASAHAQACFGNETISTLEDGVSAVYSADINGDGAMDLVTAARNNDTIAWYQSDGAPRPSFTRRVITNTADYADSVFAIDVNGDGFTDVLSASRNDNTIAWYQNLGGVVPVFIKRTITTSAASARSVYAEDMDGDGDIDVLSASYDDDTITWFENDGLLIPSFTARTVTTTANGAASVYVSDVNGDGFVDILSASVLSFEVAWYENSGTVPPTFAKRIVSTTQNRVQNVRTADFDSDGDIDIVCASTNEDVIAWFRNNGGTAPTFTEFTVTTAADGPTFLSTGDFDLDGDVDVFASSINDDTIYWFENNGAPTPQFTQWIVATGANGALGVDSVDIDADGDLDIISVSSNDDTLLLSENLRAVNLVSGLSYSLISLALADSQPGDIILAEEQHFSDRCDTSINFFGKAIELRSSGSIERSGLTATTMADGATISSAAGEPVTFFGSLDVPPGARATVRGEDVTVAGPVFLGANASLDAGPEVLLRGLPSLTERQVTGAANGLRSIATGDLNGDGFPDFVSAEEFDDAIVWYRSTGGISPGFVRTTVSTSADGASSVFIADVDGDGLDDILSASMQDNEIAWYKNSGGASPSFTRILISNSASSARSVFAADLDNDGDVDVLSASYDDDTVAWYENDGAAFPGFTRRVITTGANGASSVFVADVDGDGDNDVLSAAVLGFEIAWYENDGSSPPSFVKRVVSTSQNRPEGVHAADMDGDGDVDILSASTNEDVIAWFANNGAPDPEFTELVVSASTGGPVSLATVDLDRDGDQDVVAAALTEDVIAWYENDGGRTPTFLKRVIRTKADAARSVAVADFDGDGDMDLVAGSSRDDNISWYQNGSISDINLQNLGATILSPNTIKVVNKGVFVEQTVSLNAASEISIDATSVLEGRGELSAPIVRSGGILRPVQGSSLVVQGGFVNELTDGVGDLRSGVLDVELASGPIATSFDVTGSARLGGGLVVSASPGLLPLANFPLPPLLTAASLDPLAPRFDIVLAPVLDILDDGDVVQGTLIASYSDPGQPGGVSMIPITLEQLLFSTQNDFDAPGKPNDATVADISGGVGGLPDGVPDLVIAVPSIEGIAPQGAVVVLFGSVDGSGFSFGSAALYAGANVDAPVAVAVGDFNYDGTAEIAYANRGDSFGINDTFFLNANSSLPNPIFASPITPVQVPASFTVTDLDVGEILLVGFDRDDLLMGLRGAQSSLLTASTFNIVLGSWQSCEIDVDDIDTLVPFDNFNRGLGLNRVAATSPATNTVRVFSILNGDFDNATFVDIPTGVLPRGVVVGGIDADGVSDIVVLCEGDEDTPGSLTVIRGLAQGFAPPINLPITSDPAVEPMPTSVTLADIDDDLDLDIVIVSVNEQGVRSVRQLRNTSASGSSGISFATAQDTPDQPSSPPLIVLSADLDADSPTVADDLIILVDQNAESRGGDPSNHLVQLTTQDAPCIADFNNDGLLNFFDFATYLTAYNSQDPAADLAAPFGQWNFFDLAAFVGLFNQGCP